MSSNLKDVLEKLPDRLRPCAESYAKLLIDKSFAELEAFASALAEGNWENAYSVLVSTMSSEELTEELGRINAKLGTLDDENAERIIGLRMLFRNALLAGLALMKAEIEM